MFGLGGFGYGGYGGFGGYGAGYGGGGYGATWGIRWIFALLILIVIVLQFGRRNEPVYPVQESGCCETDGTVTTGSYGANYPYGFQAIDNSVLFIIVLFLLVLCGGCFSWGGAGGGYGYY